MILDRAAVLDAIAHCGAVDLDVFAVAHAVETLERSHDQRPVVVCERLICLLRAVSSFRHAMEKLQAPRREWLRAQGPQTGTLLAQCSGQRKTRKRPMATPNTAPRRGRGRVLVVDDEADVRA